DREHCPPDVLPDRRRTSREAGRSRISKRSTRSLSMGPSTLARVSDAAADRLSKTAHEVEHPSSDSSARVPGRRQIVRQSRHFFITNEQRVKDTLASAS